MKTDLINRNPNNTYHKYERPIEFLNAQVLNCTNNWRTKIVQNNQMKQELLRTILKVMIVIL